MSLYVDSSALLKRYIDEPDSEVAESFLRSDPSLLTARHTIMEVRRNLARLLGGASWRPLAPPSPATWKCFRSSSWTR